MDENSECKSCKTWEEDMYWKHFSFMHFCLTLPSDFHDHLKLPEKFAAHMKVQLPNKVSLKGPSGALWDIHLLKADDLLFVGDEWKAFVKANDLKENCLLVFKYKRNSNFEVLIFDQETSCERESAYFVRKCMHADKKKRTAREEASSAEVMEEDCADEGDAFVVSKKSRKDDGAVIDSGNKLKTRTPKKRVPVASKRRSRPRRVVLPHDSPDRPKVQSRKKSISNELAKEVSQNSQRNVITPDNHHSHELEPQCNNLAEECLNGDVNPKEQNQISRELNNPENGKVFPTDDHSPRLKGQSGKQPSRNGTAKESRQNSERDFIPNENGENVQAVDLSNKLEAQTEKRPRTNDTSKELKLMTPEKGERLPVTDTSQAEMVRKEPIGRSSAKMVRPDYRESSSEDGHSSRGKRGGGRGRGRGRGGAKPTTSSQRLVFNNEAVSDGRRFSREYISERRPVTEVEKKNTLQRAIQNETENSFIAVMRPTTVYKRFFLSVPLDWVQKHLSSRNHDFVLRVGDRTWHTSFCYYGKKSAGFSTGWKKFSLENSLEEFDVLLFKLVGQNDNAAVVMDVDIFRVVDNVVPPLPVVF